MTIQSRPMSSRRLLTWPNVLILLFALAATILASRTSFPPQTGQWTALAIRLACLAAIGGVIDWLIVISRRNTRLNWRDPVRLVFDLLRYELALAILVVPVVAPWLMVMRSNPGEKMLVYGWLLGFGSIAMIGIASTLAFAFLFLTRRRLRRA